MFLGCPKFMTETTKPSSTRIRPESDEEDGEDVCADITVYRQN
jgi:hypothetical protein